MKCVNTKKKLTLKIILSLLYKKSNRSILSPSPFFTVFKEKHPSRQNHRNVYESTRRAATGRRLSIAMRANRAEDLNIVVKRSAACQTHTPAAPSSAGDLARIVGKPL